MPAHLRHVTTIVQQQNVVTVYSTQQLASFVMMAAHQLHAMQIVHQQYVVTAL